MIHIKYTSCNIKYFFSFS